MSKPRERALGARGRQFSPGAPSLEGLRDRYIGRGRLDCTEGARDRAFFGQQLVAGVRHEQLPCVRVTCRGCWTH